MQNRLDCFCCAAAKCFPMKTTPLPRVLVACLVCFSADFAMAVSTFTVNNTNDSGTGSLRQAILDANSTANSGGPDVINFAIPGGGVKTISPLSALPAITDPVVINGYTQSGSTQNTNATGAINAVLAIELNGASAGSSNGLTIAAGSSKVQGLAINRFSGQGIELAPSGGNAIEGNFIGTDVTGSIVRQNGLSGIFVGSPNNVIGGTTPAARNLSSGNFFHGVEISVSTATGNQVRGNLIGTNAAGTASLSGTTSFGVFITLGAKDNFIGGTTPAARNVIAGNVLTGVALRNSSGNRIEGNFIGTDVNGTAALANANGISIENSNSNVVGGTAPGAGNLISGNVREGVDMFGAGSTGNLVQGNFIGTNITGTGAVPNGRDGVEIDSNSNTVGGTTLAARNVISGNSDDGVDLGSGATLNNVQGNYIGTAADGSTALGNGSDGVDIDNSPDNYVGGAAPSEGNVISGNGGNGIEVTGIASADNQFSGNLIGRNAANTAALGNGGHGLFFLGSGPNIVGGGFNPNNRNVIAHNGLDGVAVVFAVQSSIRKGILENSIFDNGGLGIDLENDGVTPNDPLDPDTGANALQNYPVLTSAVAAGGATTIKGTLNSTPNTLFRIEFFSSQVADPSAQGEGQTFLGSKEVMTVGDGNASFTAVLPGVPPPGQPIITSTATDTAEMANTSEFSNAIQIFGSRDRLLNMSTRMRVLTGDNVLIGGLIISGTGPENVLIRSTGPSMKVNGTTIPGALLDPTLTLHDGNGAQIAFNDDWENAPEPERTQIRISGLKPEDPREPAILRTLEAGGYTAIVRGKMNTIGIATVEVYEREIVSTPTGPNGAIIVSAARLANISARGFCDTGDNLMIDGAIVGGGGGGGVRAIIRGIGPSMTVNGVPVAGRMTDPTIELFNANGMSIASNNDWRTTQEREIRDTGLAPADNAEAALITILPPGATTAHLRGNNNSTGIGLIEIYELPEGQTGD